ncbi:MAG TPA: DUF2249 domain-containing protein [Agromyces sp.]|nr:DUF2249 domain-containing protein [Agromyces sp.]
MTKQSVSIDSTSHAASAAPAAGDHTCNCGHEDSERIVLDATSIPHAIRHATIFGALDAIHPGFSLDLIAPHDPLPLLAQLEQREPGAFTVSYVERAPERCVVRFHRN